jgi:hypothetical protein
MNYIAPIQKKAKARLSEIQILVGISLKEREDWIRDKIRARWKLGKKPDGSFIGTYSTSNMGAEYAFFKNKINPNAGLGQVDLTLTGALGKGIKISSFNDKAEIYSTDEKYDEISNKYGEYNFNITEEEENELFAYIYDEINTKLLKYIYG